MGLLDGKVAIVTGAARGIGKAIAIRFAEEGADVAFTDLAIDDNAKATEAAINALGVRGKAYASNAADFEDTAKVVERIVADFGRIDILVNNAGITRDGAIKRMSEQQWDLVIDVNLKSAFNFIHAVQPVMFKQKNGSIVNMSSVVGVSGNANQANYAASKAGLIGLTKSVAQELRRPGLYPHRNDRTAARAHQGGVVRPDPDAPRRLDHRGGQRLRLPGQRTVELRERADADRLWRNEYLICSVPLPAPAGKSISKPTAVR